MTDQTSDYENGITLGAQEALLARADEFRQIEARYDEILREAEHRLQKAETAAELAMKNGTTDAEAMEVYRTQGAAIKADVDQRVKRLEEEYNQKYLSAE